MTTVNLPTLLIIHSALALALAFAPLPLILLHTLVCPVESAFSINLPLIKHSLILFPTLFPQLTEAMPLVFLKLTLKDLFSTLWIEFNSDALSLMTDPLSMVGLNTFTIEKCTFAIRN